MHIMKTICNCGVKLIGSNQYKGTIGVCKCCFKKGVKKYYLKNIVKMKASMRNWYDNHKEKILQKDKERYLIDRQYSLVTTKNGKKIKIIGKKRSYPVDQRCELCNQIKIRLLYHHWDDKDLSKGIYLCMHCHGLAEAIDKQIGLEQKYLNIKKNLWILKS